MGLLDIFGNASMQKMLIGKLRGMAKENDTKFILIDLTADELKLQEFKENPMAIKVLGELAGNVPLLENGRVAIERKEYEFLLNFYNNNKNLKDAKF